PATRSGLAGMAGLPPGYAATTRTPARLPFAFGSFSSFVNAMTCDVSRPITPARSGFFGSSPAAGDRASDETRTDEVSRKRNMRDLGQEGDGSYNAGQVLSYADRAVGVSPLSRSTTPETHYLPPNGSFFLPPSPLYHPAGLRRRSRSVLESGRCQGEHHPGTSDVDVRLRRPHQAGRGQAARPLGQGPR